MGGMDNSAGSMPAAAAAPSAQDDTSAPLFTVCISAMPDGTYQVSQQDSDDDQDDAGNTADDTGGGDSGAYPDSDSGTQTANSVDEALQIAGQMLQEEAGEDAGGGGADDEGDANAPVKDPKAVWDQLARKSDKARGVM